MTESDILRIWNGPTSQCNKAKILKFAAGIESRLRADSAQEPVASNQFRQCGCGKTQKHDLHCWNCHLPLIVSLSREAFITDTGHSATFCENCQSAADDKDKAFGIPEVEVLRRRSGGARIVAKLAEKEMVPREPSTGIAVIAAERWRQVAQEHWTAEHDAEHDAGELASAGAAYAMNAADQLHPYSQGDGDNLQPQIWPWDSKWWKPKDPLRDLARAGALIAAEIDKLLAASEPT